MDVDKLRKIKGAYRVTMLTAYDCQTATILDWVGIDMILVGDSLGNVVLGYDGTRQVTIEDMVRHTQAVARGVANAHIVGDMPISSYDTPRDALRNAGRLVKAGADSVKLEGLKPDVVKALLSNGIPVVGHLGLLPQTAEDLKVKGKRVDEAERILAEAIELDRLGVFAIVLECIPAALAERITESVKALTIGIGAGVHCDGQVLVVNDMLGMTPGHKPKHVKRYTELQQTISGAVRAYIDDVRSGKFPDDEHSFH